jgi:hypothetical protein
VLGRPLSERRCIMSGRWQGPEMSLDNWLNEWPGAKLDEADSVRRGEIQAPVKSDVSFHPLIAHASLCRCKVHRSQFGALVFSAASHLGLVIWSVSSGLS